MGDTITSLKVSPTMRISFSMKATVLTFNSPGKHRAYWPHNCSFPFGGAALLIQGSWCTLSSSRWAIRRLLLCMRGLVMKFSTVSWLPHFNAKPPSRQAWKGIVGGLGFWGILNEMVNQVRDKVGRRGGGENK